MAAENASTPSGKIIVRVDPDLEEIIPGFLKNRQIDIDNIHAALEKSDYDAIRVIGHTMKGVGGGYGFDPITDIGRSIEKAAIDSDGDTITVSLKGLSDYLQKVEVVYE